MGSNAEQDSITCLSYSNIENMGQVKDLIAKNELQAAVVNSKQIFSTDQLLFAAHKTLYDARNHQMKTKSIFTELLYSLYPGKSIKDALMTMGAQENSTDAIFVVFNDSEGIQAQKVTELVQGKLVPLEKVAEFADMDLIRKNYKISNCVTSQQDVLNCILTKIASKELLM